MSRISQLESLVAQVVQQQNAFITGAKTNDELPLQSPFDPSSKLRVYKNMVSEIITPQQIIDAAVLIANLNRFLATTGYDLDGNDLTVNSGWIWNISGDVYTNASDVVINIPFAASGKERIDLIVADVLNNFYRVAGTESTIGTAVAPTVPLNTLVATFITVTDGAISDPTDPDTVHQYYVGGFLSEASLEAAVVRAQASDFGFIINSGGDILEIAFYTGTLWVYTTLSGGSGVDPVARDGELKLKAKGYTSGVVNAGSGIQVNDIVFGFKEDGYYWESALCKSLAGGNQVRANYDELLGYNV